MHTAGLMVVLPQVRGGGRARGVVGPLDQGLEQRISLEGKSKAAG